MMPRYGLASERCWMRQVAGTALAQEQYSLPDMIPAAGGSARILFEAYGGACRCFAACSQHRSLPTTPRGRAGLALPPA